MSLFAIDLIKLTALTENSSQNLVEFMQIESK